MINKDELNKKVFSKLSFFEKIFWSLRFTCLF